MCGDRGVHRARELGGDTHHPALHRRRIHRRFRGPDRLERRRTGEPIRRRPARSRRGGTAPVATGCPASADYVVASGSSWGSHASIVHPQFAALFKRTALGLGFSIAQVRRQWNTLSKISVTAGSVPNTLSVNSFNAAAAALTDVYGDNRGKTPISWSTPLHGLKATLVALGTALERAANSHLTLTPRHPLGRSLAPTPHS